MQVVRKNPALVFVDIAGNACATGISAICAQRAACLFNAEATYVRSSETPRADSESGFLATKKFFDTNSLCLGEVGRNRFSDRVAARDDSAMRLIARTSNARSAAVDDDSKALLSCAAKLFAQRRCVISERSGRRLA